MKSHSCDAVSESKWSDVEIEGTCRPVCPNCQNIATVAASTVDLNVGVAQGLMSITTITYGSSSIVKQTQESPYSLRLACKTETRHIERNVCVQISSANAQSWRRRCQRDSRYQPNPQRAKAPIKVCNCDIHEQLPSLILPMQWAQGEHLSEKLVVRASIGAVVDA